MESRKKHYPVTALAGLAGDVKITMRKNLNADAMFGAIRKDFSKIADHRASNRKIPLVDALMSGLAMFSLKDQSLLAFDERRCDEPESLHGVFGVRAIPCDSQMRSTLDGVIPDSLRQPFGTLFNYAQRDKALEKLVWLKGHYLLALDGTGIYSSAKVSSPYCMQKLKRNGQIEYYQQMLAAAFVHPEQRAVLPLCPEMIIMQDGSTKQDCERNATRRFLVKFRQDHPHLQCVVIEDGLSSNGPHINDLIGHNLRFILGAKPGDHAHLFAQLDRAIENGEATEFSQTIKGEPGVTHTFRFVNGISLNKANRGLLVNVLEYWQIDSKGKETRFSWVTDLPLTADNVYEIMRAGRARWRIENEVFNTLKNQGYNLEHNFGLGEKHLSAVFNHLMMLAFLVDQIQQLCCPLFQAALQRCKRKKTLWQIIRSYFDLFVMPSMEVILQSIVAGVRIVFR
jgi:hypothetical protein